MKAADNYHDVGHAYDELRDNPLYERLVMVEKELVQEYKDEFASINVCSPNYALECARLSGMVDALEKLAQLRVQCWENYKEDTDGNE